MTYAEKYIKSFGKLTSKEIEIIKRTFGYETCRLTDAWIDLKREILEALGLGGLIK